MDLKRSLYTKDFSYKNIDGTEEVIKLYALKGASLPVLFRLAKKFNAIDTQDKDKFLELLDTETVTDLVTICTDTLKRSLPDSSIEDIDSFVGQYMLQLFPVIIDLNFSAKI
jgi:hypothetical protein